MINKQLYNTKYIPYCNACRNYNIKPMSYSLFKTEFNKHHSIVRCVANTKK